MKLSERLKVVTVGISKWYEGKVLPRAIDVVCGSAAFGRLRRDLTKDLSGMVLEVGFGSGTNASFITEAVTTCLAVEPSIEALRLGANKRNLPSSVLLVAGDGVALPIASGSVDYVIFSFVLCSVETPVAMVAECHRVLKTGGRLAFIEHGRSNSKGMAKVQVALDPIERVVAGNCRLSRRPYDYVGEDLWLCEDSGESYLGASSPWSFIYRAKYQKR